MSPDWVTDTVRTGAGPVASTVRPHGTVPGPDHVVFEGRAGRPLRITATEVVHGRKRLAVDSIDEVSYFRESMLGRWTLVALVLVLPLGLFALVSGRGRYRCRLRAGPDKIDIALRTGSSRSRRRRTAEDTWSRLLEALHWVVVPAVVDRLVDRVFVGECVRIGRVPFRADGIGASRRTTLGWDEVVAPTFDGYRFHVRGFDAAGRPRIAGTIPVGVPNAVLVPMLSRVGRARACARAPMTADAPPWPPPAAPSEALGYVGVREARVVRPLAAVLTVAMVAGAVVVRMHLADRASEIDVAKPPWATEWDPRVAAEASFVEHTRGRPFTDPVSVQFLSDADFVTWVEVEEGGMSRSGPALGLLEAGEQSGEEAALLAARVAGVYSTADRIVRIRGEEITPDVRLTLVHELTHALQDQAFDLDALRSRAGGSGTGLDAVLEGDAVTVERAYYGALAAEEQAQVTTSESGEGAMSEASDAGSAASYLPYVFGPQLIATLVESGGDTARDHAFLDPPASELGVLDPALSVIDDRKPPAVPPPPVPSGADADVSPEGGTIGALRWYLALSERVDPRLVARTIEEWNGDGYVAYRRDGAGCMDAEIRLRPLDAADHLSDAFARWGALAADGDPVVRVDGDVVRVSTCRLLSGGVEGTDAGTSLRVAFARNEMALAGLRGGLPIRTAHCIANRALIDLPVEVLSASPFELPSDWPDRAEVYRAYCDR